VARGFLYSSKRYTLDPYDARVFALCATDPDTTPAETTITKGPKKETFARRARFTFVSEAGATFTCAVDKKPAVACTSPYKVKKLKRHKRKHRFTVTATDAAGNTDPTPAVFKWKIRKKVPKGHR
jgi:hypothetical protein